jgi:hypothetical protein
MSIGMTTGMSTLLFETIKDIKNDWIIVTPFWIFFFGFQTVSLTSSPVFVAETMPSLMTILAYIGIWITELFIKCIVILLSQNYRLKRAFSQTLDQFKKVAIASSLALLPMGVLLLLLTTQAQSGGFYQFIIFVVFISIAIPALLLLQFLPLPYLLGNESLLSGITKTWFLIKDNLLSVTRCMLWIILISIISLIISGVMEQVPIIGKSVLVILNQGVIATLITLFTVKVYITILKKDTNILKKDTEEN